MKIDYLADCSRLPLKVTLIAEHRSSKHKSRIRYNHRQIRRYIRMYSARSQGHSRKENPIKEGTQFEIWSIEHTYALWNNYWNNLIWTDVCSSFNRCDFWPFSHWTQTCRDTLAVTIGNRQTNFLFDMTLMAILFFFALTQTEIDHKHIHKQAEKSIPCHLPPPQVSPSFPCRQTFVWAHTHSNTLAVVSVVDLHLPDCVCSVSYPVSCTPTPPHSHNRTVWVQVCVWVSSIRGQSDDKNSKYNKIIIVYRKIRSFAPPQTYTHTERHTRIKHMNKQAADRPLHMYV